tara:strand:+ start:592 stop:945 length:354 start_codon:yes stop_codon:yes gene_type:complete
MYTSNIRFFIGSLTVVVLLVVLTYVANAQPVVCAPMKETMERLQQQHKEALIFRGISARGHITIIHLNEDSGTWTASIIRPTDPTMMCGVDAGTTGELIDDAEKTIYGGGKDFKKLW